MTEKAYNLAVCIKNIKNYRGGEDGQSFVTNPFDLFAAEVALRIKDKLSGTRVHILTVGEDEDCEALREVLAMGADKAYLVSAKGADRSAALAKAVDKIEEDVGKIDAVFCGSQSADSGSGAVGAMLSERLGLPIITNIIDAEVCGGALVLTKEIEGGGATTELERPFLATVTKPAFAPRLPSIRNIMSANRREIKIIEVEGAEHPKIKLVGESERATKRKGAIFDEDDAALFEEQLYKDGIIPQE